jgi:hypothetical protein
MTCRADETDGPQGIEAHLLELLSEYMQHVSARDGAWYAVSTRPRSAPAAFIGTQGHDLRLF